MAIYRGPNIIRDGLILNLDAGNIKSYKGDTTTNLSYNNGIGTGSEYLASKYYWINSGTFTFNDNETDVPKPIINGLDTTNLRVISGIVTSGGSIHYGCALSPATGLTTYSVSVYYRQNNTIATQPYIRTIVTNTGIGNLSYNGNTNTATWPVNEWIRISASGTTTSSGETGIFISNYIGTVGQKIWYFGTQIEQKSYTTNLVAGSRTATWNDQINKSSFTVNSGITSEFGNGLYFYGTTASYITLGSNFTPAIYTKSVWIKTSNSSIANIISGSNDEVFYGSGGVIYLCNTWSTPVVTATINFYDNKWHNIVGTFDGTTGTLYMDGIYLNSGPLNALPARTTYIGQYGSANNLTQATLNYVQIYNRDLSPSEILQNYNAIHQRFSL